MAVDFEKIELQEMVRRLSADRERLYVERSALIEELSSLREMVENEIRCGHMKV